MELTSNVAQDGPLAGFRIVDLSRVLSGPAATTLLADQGEPRRVFRCSKYKAAIDVRQGLVPWP